MGHCDSPARLGGADRIFSADGRTPQPAAERARLIGSPNPVVAAENRPGLTARALLVLLRAYQIYLSPMNFSACRFHPSCSHYAGEAVQRFGARRGVWLTIKRLARCQPFSKGGFDPVPDRVANTQAFSKHGRSLWDTALAVSFSRPASGVLTPEANLDSSDHRATRGQEFAQ